MNDTKLINAEDVENELDRLCADCCDPYCEECPVSQIRIKIWDTDAVKAITHEQFLSAAHKITQGIQPQDLKVMNVTIDWLGRILFGNNENGR